MRTPKFLLIAAFAALTAATSGARAQESPFFAGTDESESPFAGTGEVVLTEQQQKQVNEYAGASRVKMQLALRDNAGKQPRDALPALTGAVYDVIMSSYNVARGSELLFRMVLAQALELMHGLPAAEGCPQLASPQLRQNCLDQARQAGNDWRKPGVPLLLHPVLLGPASTPRQMEQLHAFYFQILKDSVELAIQLAETESQVTDRVLGKAPSSMLDLPYANLAFHRAMTGRIWNQSAAFLSVRMEYVMLRGVINQWLKIVTNKRHIDYSAYAALIGRSQKSLRNTELTYGNPAVAPVQEVTAKTRMLRNHLNELIGELKPKFGAKGFDPARVTDISNRFAGYFSTTALKK